MPCGVNRCAGSILTLKYVAVIVYYAKEFAKEHAIYMQKNMQKNLLFAMQIVL